MMRKEGGGKPQFPDIVRQLLDGTQPLFPGPWITHFRLCYQSFLSTSDLGKSSNQCNKWYPEESTFSFIKFFFLLEYSCFIMFCQFLVYSKVDQLCVYIYPFFFGFPSHLGHHRALSRVPSAIQQVLISYLFYTQWCIYGIGDSFKNYKQNYQMTQQYHSRVYTWRKP